MRATEAFWPVYAAPTYRSQPGLPSSPSPLQALPQVTILMFNRSEKPSATGDLLTVFLLRALRRQPSQCTLGSTSNAQHALHSAHAQTRMHAHLGYTIWEEATGESPCPGPWALFVSAFEVYPLFPLISRKHQLICIVFWKRVWAGSWVRPGTSFLITLKVKGTLKKEGKILISSFFF